MRPLFSLLLLVCLASPAQGSWVKSYSLDALYREADLVVRGAVIDSTSFWNDEHDRIYTEYEIAPSHLFKGQSSTPIRVRLMGGIVGDKELIISGNPTITKGEDVLLFLRSVPNFYVVVGMSQGKWSVRDIDGTPHVFRGKSQGALEKADGEIPLERLLEKCGVGHQSRKGVQ